MSIPTLRDSKNSTCGPASGRWRVARRKFATAGDLVIYQIAGRSLMIVRQQDGGIRAFHNSCLHRGRMLATVAGNRREIRCPFHGMAWHIDGSFKHNPIEWDFPQWRCKSMSLPEAKVETWGGFVFVNMDAAAAPLDTVLGPIKEHFDRYPTRAHVHRAACSEKSALQLEGGRGSLHGKPSHRGDASAIARLSG